MWLRVVFWWWLAGLVHGTHNRKGTSCLETQRQCFLRTGCNFALNRYMEACSGVVGRGDPRCPVQCQNALIALTSTEEGKDLMTCTCNDEYCKKTKERVEICKPDVLRATQNETMSCNLSQLICSANAGCATALEYYKKNCRSMFQGKKCTRRCHNSINILRKQEKATKLDNCVCDPDNYECLTVKDNMDRLCFHKVKSKEDTLYNLIGGDPNKNAARTNKSDLVTILTIILVIRIIVPG